MLCKGLTTQHNCSIIEALKSIGEGHDGFRLDLVFKGC